VSIETSDGGGHRLLPKGLLLLLVLSSTTRTSAPVYWRACRFWATGTYPHYLPDSLPRDCSDAPGGRRSAHGRVQAGSPIAGLLRWNFAAARRLRLLVYLYLPDADSESPGGNAAIFLDTKRRGGTALPSPERGCRPRRSSITPKQLEHRRHVAGERIPQPGPAAAQARRD